MRLFFLLAELVTNQFKTVPDLEVKVETYVNSCKLINKLISGHYLSRLVKQQATFITTTNRVCVILCIEQSNKIIVMLAG